jgi:CDP-diacylglycerol--serine O-phosphatidyltransferase
MTSKNDKPDANNPEHKSSFFSVDEHEEEVIEQGQPIRRKGIYILPNLFTTGNLFCGFYSIILAQNGMFGNACIAIFIAMILDTLDGRVARMTNTTSKFGEQYDSLADMLTFGIAPAFLSYFWSLQELGKLGWIIAFVYTACTALRLARFNAQISDVVSKYFTGLPSPSSAGVITSLVWMLHDFELLSKFELQSKFIVNVIVATVTLAVAMLMVSNIKYSSFKSIDFKGRVHFIFGVCAVLLFVVIFVHPPRVLFLIFAAYSMSGLLLSMLKNKDTTN